MIPTAGQVEAFATNRGRTLESWDDRLIPAVRRALDLLYVQQDVPAWMDPVVEAASALWVATFEESGLDVTAAHVLGFETVLRTHLAQTSTRPGDVTQAQVDRVAHWVAVFAVNHASWNRVQEDPDAPGEVMWVTRGDEKVRGSHQPLHGQTRPIGGTFNVDGFNLHYPGEPVGPPENWIQCRCLLMPLEAVMTTTAAAPSLAPQWTGGDAGPDAVEPPGWVDDEVDTLVPWHGVLAPVDVRSGDRRELAANSLRYREFPLPLRWQKADADEHGGSVVVGNITRAWEDGGLIRAEGTFADSAEADEIITLIAQRMQRGVSIDVDDVTFELVADDGTAFDVESFRPGDPQPITRVTDGRITSASIVAIPAFQEAYIELGPWEDATEQAVLADGLLAAADCAPCVAAELDGYYQGFASQDVSEEPWDGSASRFTDEQWVRSCVLDRGEQYATAKTRWALPIREPDGRLSRAGTFAAAARVNQVVAAPQAVAEAKRRLLAAYRVLDAQPPDVLQAAARLWGATRFVSAPGTHDGPGWVTDPVPTQRLRDYWTHGAGAAKIRWGQPGDFNRCRQQLAKYVPNPRYLAGTCANLHKVAMGIWPGAHGRRRGHAGDEIEAFAGDRRAAIRNAVADALGVPIRVLPASVRADLDMVIDEALERRSDSSSAAAVVDVEEFADRRAAIRNAIADALGVPVRALSGEARAALNRVIDAALQRRSSQSASALTLVADARPRPPRAWFDDPHLPGPTPLTVDGDRVYGHLALWGTCHVGLGLSVGDGDACVTAPRSPSGYAYFNTGLVDTDAGPVEVGHITLGTGHAPASMAARPAAAHYDNTGSVAADVRVGEDQYGVWFAGVVRPGADVDVLRAASLSGDWRTIRGSYELVAALAVNVPGFPIPRLQIAASGDGTLGLVAAGVVTGERANLTAHQAQTVRDVYKEVTAISERVGRRRALRTKMRSQMRMELASRAKGAG